MSVSLSKRWLWWLVPVLPVAVVLYYAIGAGMAQIIDDDPEYGPGPIAQGQSHATALAARLILREVDEHKWVANDPFFIPTWILDDMPAYQTGMVAAISSFVGKLGEVNAVNGEVDAELARASGFLKYPGTIWKFDPRTSWAPTASSEKQYRAAARNVLIYDEHVGANTAQFRRDDEAFLALLGHFAADMDSAASRLSAHLEQPRWVLIDSQADDVFYDAKGRLYAQSLILRELGWDFAQTISRRDLGDEWLALQAALRQAAMLAPMMVIAGHDDSTFLPNHLANQGFRLLQARARLARIITRLRESS